MKYNIIYKYTYVYVCINIEYKIYSEDLRSQMIKGLKEKIKTYKQYVKIPEYNLFDIWFNYGYKKSIKQMFKEQFEFIYKAKSNTIKWVETEHKTKVVKIRIVNSRIDYQKIVRSFLDARNLKYWDKTTNKTSNKGLKAFHYREYYDYDGNTKKEWVFGGIKIEDLKEFCMNNNYQTVDKNGKRKDNKIITKEYKNHLYGILANWVLE